MLQAGSTNTYATNQPNSRSMSLELEQTVPELVDTACQTNMAVASTSSKKEITNQVVASTPGNKQAKASSKPSNKKKKKTLEEQHINADMDIATHQPNSPSCANHANMANCYDFINHRPTNASAIQLQPIQNKQNQSHFRGAAQNKVCRQKKKKKKKNRPLRQLMRLVLQNLSSNWDS
jgi:hypothetical protein